MGEGRGIVGDGWMEGIGSQSIRLFWRRVCYYICLCFPGLGGGRLIVRLMAMLKVSVCPLVWVPG